MKQDNPSCRDHSPPSTCSTSLTVRLKPDTTSALCTMSLSYVVSGFSRTVFVPTIARRRSASFEESISGRKGLGEQPVQDGERRRFRQPPGTTEITHRPDASRT